MCDKPKDVEITQMSVGGVFIVTIKSDKPNKYKLYASESFGSIDSNELTLETIPPKGRSSQTGYQWPEVNSIRRQMIDRARGSIDQLAPQSIYLQGATWYTDVDEKYGDGARMLNAYKAKAAWDDYSKFKNQFNRPTPTDLKTISDTLKKSYGDIANTVISKFDKSSRRQIMLDQIDTNEYTPKHKGQLVDTILADGDATVPVNDNQAILDRLSIKMQCAEWLHHIVNSSQGSMAHKKRKNYNDELAPGMGLVTSSHSMLVTDVEYDGSGRIVNVWVVDSNWSDNWSNPTGDRPWERRIREAQISLRKIVGPTAYHYDYRNEVSIGKPI